MKLSKTFNIIYIIRMQFRTLIKPMKTVDDELSSLTKNKTSKNIKNAPFSFKI